MKSCCDLLQQMPVLRGTGRPGLSGRLSRLCSSSDLTWPVSEGADPPFLLPAIDGVCCLLEAFLYENLNRTDSDVLSVASWCGPTCQASHWTASVDEQWARYRLASCPSYP